MIATAFSRMDTLVNNEDRGHLWSGLNWDSPTLVVSDVNKAIELYEKVFGFVRVFVLPNQNNQVIFARMRYRGTHFTIMQDDDASSDDSQLLNAESPPTISFYLYVDDVERVYYKALAADCRSLQSPHNNFLGDRKASLMDIFGYVWDIAARV